MSQYIEQISEVKTFALFLLIFIIMLLGCSHSSNNTTPTMAQKQNVVSEPVQSTPPQAVTQKAPPANVSTILFHQLK